ncbi:MAG: RNA-directed DNA polymerase [Polyangiaceae bacterium]
MTPEDVFSLRALWAAARRAGQGKKRRPGVARFWLDLEGEFCSLRDDLLSGRWSPSRPHHVEIRDPKPRQISVLPFRDRVVHQALGAVLGPRIERRMIRDTYASRVGLGTHAALRRARAWARTYRFFVHLDVQQFFPAMDHAIVLRHIAQDNPEPWLQALCTKIVESGEGAAFRAHFPGDDLFTPSVRAVGLPLGSLTSQMWANRYLDPVDHLAKDKLRIRPYLRYMDDMLVFHHERTSLMALARTLEHACWELRLRLHPYEVRPTAAGVGFVGYRILPDSVRVRRTAVARAERRLRAAVDAFSSGVLDSELLCESLRATFAHWNHADAWRLKGRVLHRLGILYVAE